MTDQNVRYFNDYEEKRSKRLEKELAAIATGIRTLTAEFVKLNVALERWRKEIAPYNIEVGLPVTFRTCEGRALTPESIDSLEITDD